MHATSRSVVAAARTHPAGVAAPSAVIVTAIILFTLVTSVIVPSIRPGLFGIGSAAAGQAVQAASQVPAGTAVGQAPSGAATTVVGVADQVHHRRSAESSSEQAGPGAGTLPGAG